MSEVVYLKYHPTGAGKWIYEGYARAWASLGYEVVFFNDINQVEKNAKFIMTTEADLIKGFDVISSAEKSFLFVQPFSFPDHWGNHPNWITSVNKDVVERTNTIETIKKWTFVNNVESDDYKPWCNVNYLPLAFDSLGYQLPNLDFKKDFDVCFVGGWANNGYDEKRARIINHLELIQKSGIRCGFFINSGLTHEQENYVICSSKVALNIHDEYQVKLGLDLNERTFKSLAMSGILVSDNVREMKNLFSHIKVSNNPMEMLSIIEKYLTVPEEELMIERKINRDTILKEHTYIKRVERLLQL